VPHCRQQPGGRRSQRTAAGQAHDPVEHEVDTIWRLVADPPAGSAQRRQALRVHPVRAQQHCCHHDAAAAQVCPGPQRVTAVVARPNEQRNVPAGHPPGPLGQRRRNSGSEPERGAPHQRASWHPREQGVFGGPDSGHRKRTS